MRNVKGFTLIEILVALAIFALLAMITSSSMYYAFDIKNRLSVQSNQINKLQLTLILLNKSIYQTVNRAVRIGDMQLQSSFIGSNHYLEFTRAGGINPESLAKISTLQRMAYLCQGSNLIERTWVILDSTRPSEYQDKLLLSGLVTCKFSYLNRALQVLGEWHNSASDFNQKAEALPKAIQLKLSYKAANPLVYTFPIPEAQYGSL